MTSEDLSSDSDTGDKMLSNLKLIEQISIRPALYNYQLPIEQRNKKIRLLLWEECAQELQTTVFDCQRRFRNLRDTYHLYRQHHQNLLKKWRYTKSLSFLQNIHTVKIRRKRKGNCSNNYNQQQLDESQDEDNDEFAKSNMEENEIITNELSEKCIKNEKCLTNDECFSDSGGEKISKFTHKRVKKGKDKKDKKKQNELEETNTDSMIVLNKNNVNLLNESKDEIDLFLEFLNKKIRKLPLEDINEIQRNFLEIVLEKESKLIVTN